ncbi:hypothetical protein GCM10009821_21800 [Aeromicrobium halocynthiae]|uniref:BD-FAE-like domain-containing protein n=1 Tax=Aeromicrobium halocynthiae TaxID=560557 RepID=A0ABN2W2U2_9ACTN
MRRLGRLVVVLLLAVVAAGQLLAWTPPSWWVPVLQWWPSQYAVIILGVVRDALGFWVVVAAALLLSLAVLTGPRDGTSPWRRPATVVAVVTLGSSVVLHGLQVAQAREEGADVSVVSPSVPFLDPTPTPDREVVVGTVGDDEDLLADLYLPDDPEPGGAPVVVRVHGGGFDSGSKAPSPYFTPLLAEGFAVLDVTYRLASPDRQTWDTAVADVGCALTWISVDGVAAGLDPTRVGTLGESAGGQLAVNAANLGVLGELDPSCRTADDLPDVGAVVTGYPAVDGGAAYEDSALGRGFGDRYIGGPRDELPERYALTDSVNHVSADGAPLLIYQGSADHLILPGPVRAFAQASADAGTLTRYVELRGQEHTTGGGLGTLSLGDLVGRDLTTGWFVEHLR